MRTIDVLQEIGVLYVVLGSSLLALALLSIWGLVRVEDSMSRADCIFYLIYSTASGIGILIFQHNRLDEYFLCQLGLLSFTLITVDQVFQLSLSSLCLNIVKKWINNQMDDKVNFTGTLRPVEIESPVNTEEFQCGEETSVVSSSKRSLRFISDPDE